MKLADIGTGTLVMVRRDDPIDKAIVLMEEHGVRHLPVVGRVDDLVGIVSDRDILSAVGWTITRFDRIEGEIDRGGCVAEIMRTPVHTLAPTERAETGVRLLLRERISAVPLAEGRRIVGIVTVTDFLRCFSGDRPPELPRGWAAQTVATCMRHSVFTLGPEEPLSQAFRLMHRRQVRHVPILKGGRPVGMVSDRDLRRAAGRQNQRAGGGDPGGPPRTLREIMSAPVDSVAPDALLPEAAKMLLDRRIGALPVLAADGTLCGLVTETDLLHVLAAALDL